MKNMKNMFKKHFTPIAAGMEKRVKDDRDALFSIQKDLANSPMSGALISKEFEALKVFRKTKFCQFLFLRQKSKINWMKAGDMNSKFFHGIINGNKARNKILSIKSSSGDITTDPTCIKSAFVNFFKSSLGRGVERCPLDKNIVNLGNSVSEAQSSDLVKDFTDKEILIVLEKIGNDKAPGPDGFSAKFFKKNWGIIGKEISDGIRNCFRFNKLPRSLNSTILTLIPKYPSPELPSNFRPIACCNVIYKIISGILSDRLNAVLPSIIDPAQGAFVQGRSIIANISLSQQLLLGYNRKNTSQRCTWKIDIRKAYDSVSWDFLKDMLIELNFPYKFVSWILMCVSSANYSININGESCGYFEGKRGLRQGDPISPFLFTIVMEYLSRALKSMSRDKEFSFHPKCVKAGITHLLFADDLLIFCKGKAKSINLVNCTVKSFLSCSGLDINYDKSQIISCGIPVAVKEEIQSSTGCIFSALPIKYLGIPLNGRSLNSSECSELTQRLVARFSSWQNRLLSRAGRVVLIKSVIHAICVYWSRVFIIPGKVLKAVNALCANYLLKGASDKTGGHRISWDTICLPKEEGGLGIKCLRSFNKALVIKQIWDLRNMNNMWTTWLREYWTKGANWWDDLPANSSWVIKRLEKCKNLISDINASSSRNTRGADSGSEVLTRAAYDYLRPKRLEQAWYPLVWSSINRPKDAIEGLSWCDQI